MFASPKISDLDFTVTGQKGSINSARFDNNLSIIFTAK